MTADIEMLPLPEADDSVENHAQWPIVIDSDVWLQKSVQDYARACVVHAASAKDAEIEALREEKERWRILCNGESARRMDAEDHAERLAEALHKLEDACDDSDGAQYGTLGTSFVRGICKNALLRDHDQEVG